MIPTRCTSNYKSLIIMGKIDYAHKTTKILTKPKHIQGLKKDDIINMMLKFPEK